MGTKQSGWRGFVHEESWRRTRRDRWRRWVQGGETAEIAVFDRSCGSVDEIARFCLGRFWRDATPGQQREYLQLFHSVLVREVVVRLGDYQQEVVHITVGDPERNGDDTNVPSVVKRAGNPPVQVKWVLEGDGEGFRIVDMLAEGVSMRLTVRNDYDSFITSHDDNISELLSALRRQAAS